MPVNQDKPAQAPEKASGVAKAKAPPEARPTDPDELLITLAEMDDRARAAGLSLAQIIEKAARDGYGVSIIAPPAEPELPRDD